MEIDYTFKILLGVLIFCGVAVGILAIIFCSIVSVDILKDLNLKEKIIKGVNYVREKINL